ERREDREVRLLAELEDAGAERRLAGTEEGFEVERDPRLQARRHREERRLEQREALALAPLEEHHETPVGREDDVRGRELARPLEVAARLRQARAVQRE